ncbi:DUF4062 domain-containing protein [Kaistella yonginensis]|uniref:DUF4062 domain-containing protein n=1 Tax=Kaistella yonginensis TaxID=658267 RepID=UPI0025B28205|nr:DUF4062 domain-containing protein [Kaistella yonginensis]MDN3606434.1 DUF4062 domain-containing protein [Kaistella yonginensis]
MAKKITQYSIFVSSPQDLETERAEISNIIAELNITYAMRKSANLEVLKWETHSAPGISETYTQDIINRDIGENYDVFIGMLWQKFGTKTEIANSGTEEEFMKAVERFKIGESIQILFYFKTTPPISLDQLNLEDLIKIQNFKDYLKKNNILYGSFNTLEDLQTNLRLHIPKRIDEIIEKNILIVDSKSEKSKKDIDETVTISDEEDDENNFGLIDFIYQFEDFLADSNLALLNISDSTNRIGEELAEKAEEITRISKYPNPNKNIIIEYFKRSAKSLNTFSDRLELEIPNFYDNFEDAINVGLRYLNIIDKNNIKDHYETLKSNYESVSTLKKSIPSAIEGMTGFYDEMKKLPNMQSNLNKAKRRLLLKMEDLIFKLRKSYELTNEFQGQLEYKLNLHDDENNKIDTEQQ